MKQRLKKFLGHNLFITFILTIAVFWWIPLNSDLYRFTPLTERNWHTLSSRFAYNNLDTLPDLENILYYEWDDHTVTMVVNKDNTAIQQWKFTGQLQKKLMNVVVCDIFSDGLKEIASFYVKGNLLMFSVISPFENEEAIVEDYIIDSIPGQNPATFSINDSKFHDLNHDQIPELVFLVDGDYNQQPRNLYAFDFKSGELLKSPESATILEDIHFFDIDNDGNSEITGWVKSNCNYFDAPGATQPFPDTISWLMVFDHNLIYKFPPIGFPGRHSRVYPIIIDEEDHSELFVIHSTKFEGNQFFNIGHDGLKTSHEHKDLPSSVLNFCFNIHEDGGDNILWTDQSGTIGTYSLVEGTKTLQRKKAKESFYHIDDVIGDKGEEYWTFSSFNEWQFNLHNSKGQLLAREKFPKEHGSDFNPVINVVEKKDHESIVSFQLGMWSYLIRIEKNPGRYLRLLFFVALFGIMYLVVLIIQRIQMVQIREKEKMRTNILQLQMNAMHNQLDPHFTFNALNVLSALSIEGNYDIINKFVTHFSQLFRSYLQSSEKIWISLREEISFVENYIALQQIRFEDQWRFVKEIDLNCDPDILIPKMLIHNHIENAIKHGLRPKSKAGVLSLQIFEDNNNLLIRIEDNGVGRIASKANNSQGAGIGLKSLEKLLKYDSVEKNRKIKQIVTDLFQESGEPSGTRIEIIIPINEN